MSAEKSRLSGSIEKRSEWKKWGPYLSERQWGTVREDYSHDGNAWDYFSHDQARSRAYRWGEDGLAGISDDRQLLCFALALWNGKDAILKERLFGLTNSEGNHGEDVKEYYYYLDSTPTHSYMKYLYKYPQAAFPYEEIIKKNRERSRFECEFELIDTGAFDQDRYFDVFVEYAKASAEDILIKIQVHNRGPENAVLHVLPTIWFRNTWATEATKVRPQLSKLSGAAKFATILAKHSELGDRYLYCDNEAELLFTENETNSEQLFGTPNITPFVKDGINNAIVNGRQESVNQKQTGTKACAHYKLEVDSGGVREIRLRLTNAAPNSFSSRKGTNESAAFDANFSSTFDQRRSEADQFYTEITPASCTPDQTTIMRQALAGMLWSKQFYYFDANRWLLEHNAHPLSGSKGTSRNRDWFHMVNRDIISMPDKWEYPWYAAWDLAFHTGALSMVDTEFAKEQLELMLTGRYLHPNGQIPAYEWNFGDVNPPVHAWATLMFIRGEQAKGEQLDFEFLNTAFQKLALNFTWWVNRKDRAGNNVFEGGFLGLDNIGIFDRSAPLPTGGYIEQADGTAWMAFFTQNMLELAAELATFDPSYGEMITKYADHFLWIAAGMNRPGDQGMWDEDDGFYYDILQLPDGSAQRLKVRSMVGLLPLCAATVIEPWQRDQAAGSVQIFRERLEQMPDLFKNVHPTGPGHYGVGERGLCALLNPDRLRRVLSKMLDENEFLSDYGIRSLSKFHEKNPYILHVNGQEHRVDYAPAESTTGAFGGNSNWRGPIWMPVNMMIVRALMNYFLYYGDNFKIECPTGSGNLMNLFEVAKEITDRLTRIFERDKDGQRPVFGASKKFQNDPHWKDNILFYEYFHGENGAGIGASHQTGWSGGIARLMQVFASVTPAQLLKSGKMAAFQGGVKPPFNEPSKAANA